MFQKEQLRRITIYLLSDIGKSGFYERKNMFDFYKELFLELQGIKVEKKLDKEIKEDGEKKKVLIPLRAKVCIWILGFWYLIIATIGVMALIDKNQYIGLVKYIILVPIDIICMILALFKSTKIQKITIGFTILFIVLYFSSIMM